MTIYMAITSDRFELPLYVSESSGDLARKMGVTTNMIYTEINRKHLRKNQGTKRGFTFTKVVVEDD